MTGDSWSRGLRAEGEAGQTAVLIAEPSRFGIVPMQTTADACIIDTNFNFKPCSWLQWISLSQRYVVAHTERRLNSAHAAAACFLVQVSAPAAGGLHSALLFVFLSCFVHVQGP